jgi:transcriptional regulator with XRE-family HTH domain
VIPIGERIRQLRIEKGLSQDRLSIIAGVDQSGLSKLERGERRGVGIASASRVARALGIGLQELVMGTDKEGLARRSSSPSKPPVR